MALGMARQLQQTVAVCCTSGSALLNIYPAVSEAYYMQVPLLVLSADRPAELLDRWDGQAIHQKGVFGPHVKASFETEPTEDAHVACGLEAVRLSMSGRRGPVHINVPLSEPLYTEAGTRFTYPEISVSVQARPAGTYSRGFSLNDKLRGNKKILILCGCDDPSPESTALLKELRANKHVVVIGDVLSGRHAASVPANWESEFAAADAGLKASLVPDLLISTGKMILNKTLRAWLRNNKPKQHWHISQDAYCADPFFTNPDVLQESDADFFRELKEAVDVFGDKSYADLWRNLGETNSAAAREKLADTGYNEFSALRAVLRALPAGPLQLHAANSMSVRLLAYSAGLIRPQWELYCNRGVSGIDGCTSTAMGMALLSGKPNILITGDLAFFYDANAFLTRVLPRNLKIVVLNNSGGGIFLSIDGPSEMKESDPYLITPHRLSAQHVALQHGLKYFRADAADNLQTAIQAFTDESSLCILEICTDMSTNTKHFKQYKQLHV